MLHSHSMGNVNFYQNIDKIKRLYTSPWPYKALNRTTITENSTTNT